MEIANNLRRIRSQIDEAAARVDRDPRSIRLIGAAKTKGIELVGDAIAAGLCDVGENYLQEGAEKIPQLPNSAHWHMIGHVQRNKARKVVELFDTIHTVDSARLAASLGHHAKELQKTIEILIEVNLANESSKRGIAAMEIPALIDVIAEEPRLRLIGLMALPPFHPDPEQMRPYFHRLREMRDHLETRMPQNVLLNELSMGMSNDFPVAIEEGATMIRIGTALFGERQKRKVDE